MTCTDSRLRKLFHAPTSSGCSTTRARPSTPSASSARFAAPVFGTSKFQLSTTITFESAARSLSADRSASFFIFLGVRWSYLRGLGPRATPPPRQMGDRVEPARARPVPFCLYGLEPPPDTSARVLVDC